MQHFTKFLSYLWMILLKSSEQFTERSFDGRHCVVRPRPFPLRSENLLDVSQTLSDLCAVRSVAFRRRNHRQIGLVIDGPGQHSGLQLFGLFLHGLQPLFALHDLRVLLAGWCVQDVLDVKGL